MSEKSGKSIDLIYLLIYYGLLAATAIGSLYPGKFWFAFNFGLYIPFVTNWVLLAVFAVLPLIMYPIRKWLTQHGRFLKLIEANGKLTLPISFVVVITLFYLLRAKGFYLGDGESLLSSVASSHPIIKLREIGESISHVWLCQLLGGPNESAALLSYQILSISAGCLFLLSAVVLSKRIFDTFAERFSFVALWFTGGYALLFFGYVENYSLLSLAVAVLCVVGLLVVKKQLSRYWILPVYCFAVLMHGLALALTPALLLVLVNNTGIESSVRAWSRATKLMLAILVSVTGIAAFLYLSSTNFFFRFAFVPLFENRFTVDHYTLFSVRHLTDIGNLLIVLFPAALLALVALVLHRRTSVLDTVEKLFLLTTVASTFAVLLFLDPKLGMPRDWDLFAFVGVPLGLLISIYIVRISSKRSALTLTIVALLLNLMFLTQRVIVNQNEDAAFEQFYDYYNYTPLLNQNSFFQIVDYFRHNGDEARVTSEHMKWNKVNPSWGSNAEGKKLMDAGRMLQAIDLFREAISTNQAHSAAYSNLGASYLQIGELDSALSYLTIARGMNPYNPRVNYNYGLLYFRLGNSSEAENSLLRAIEIEPTLQDAHQGLMTIYRKSGRMDDYFVALASAVELGGAPAHSFRQLIEHNLKKNDYQTARGYLKKLSAFPDQSAYVDTLLQIFPQLR